jgi:hypothetical protein
MKKTDLEKMKQVDIRTVEKSQLVDIGNIAIDKSSSKEERLLQFIKDVKNPYCFLCEGIIVKSSFCENEESLDIKLARLISQMDEK